jgi:hypothetical protein
MPDPNLKITPAIPIPAFMVGEVQSKLAYVDESIEKAIVQVDGNLIDIKLKSSVKNPNTDEITAKVQEVITLMVKGVIQPRTQVLESYLDRLVPNHTDPMVELLERQEVFKEGRGIYTLGPLISGLIGYFESRFIGFGYYL